MEYLIIILSYLIGSLPSGYFIVKYFSNKDLRKEGSNSVGATNVGRLLGKKGFLLTFCIDCLKAFVFIFLISKLLPNPYILELSVLSLVVGHIYPVFLRFKGGKGIAVALGALLAYNYILVIVLTISLGLLYLIIRKFTISGLVALLILPVYSIVFVKDTRQFVFLCLLNLIILMAHREHLMRYKKQDV